MDCKRSGRARNQWESHPTGCRSRMPRDGSNHARLAATGSRVNSRFLSAPCGLARRGGLYTIVTSIQRRNLTSKLAHPIKCRMETRRARFVDEYLVDGNGTAAAIRAGYAPAGAHVTASRLLRDPKVAAALAAGQAEKRAESKITRQAVLERLQAAYEAARLQSQPAAMIAAAREMSRLCGLYAPEKRIVATVGADTALAELEAMTDQELEGLISRT